MTIADVERVTLAWVRRRHSSRMHGYLGKLPTHAADHFRQRSDGW
jgi:hypothetical protein